MCSEAIMARNPNIRYVPSVISQKALTINKGDLKKILAQNVFLIFDLFQLCKGYRLKHENLIVPFFTDSFGYSILVA